MLAKIYRFVICVDSPHKASMEKILDENLIQVLDIDNQNLFQKVQFYCESNPERLANLEKDCEKANFMILMRRA